MSVSPSIWAAWGKSKKDLRHPLVCHVLDTAAVAERLFAKVLGPRIREELLAAFEPLGDAEGWIAVLCGLHDLGKYAPGFQALGGAHALEGFGHAALADVEAVRRPDGLRRRIDIPHGWVTAMHMKDLLLSWNAPVDTAEHLAAALGGHHGDFPDGTAVGQARREVGNHGRTTWRAWRDEMVEEVFRARRLDTPGALPWHDVRLCVVPALGLAALTTISDWIASDVENFAFAEPVDIAAYAQTAQDRADTAVDRLQFRAWIPPRCFADLYPDLSGPQPVQEVVERLTTEREEPTLVLVEAPTGEGKSKAGLQAAAALVRSLSLAGTYVAMPTQATSNQIFAELEALRGADAPRAQLIHSNAREYLDQRSANPSGVGLDDPEDFDVIALEWFTRKKNLLVMLGVGTVDQLLKAVIRSPHVFVRLLALSNKVVVIDEVHAYDTYMSRLLDRLLAWLGRLGVSVVMLSATLPGKRRRELVAEWQSGRLGCLTEEVPALEPSTAYPRVTVADSGTPRVESAGLSERNTERRFRLVPVADEDIADWALKQLDEHQSVAIVHNLVRRARDSYAAIEKRLAALPFEGRPKLIMINGQLANGVRRAVEADLRSWFGPDGTRPRAIVVGTQVLEQGLDLDFDAMLTDLAPVDCLIQRAGRLRRHRCLEPGEVLDLAISGVVDTDDGPRFPRYLDRVYAPMVMLRTWALLRNRKPLSLPDEVTPLVNALYGPPDAVSCPSGWEDAWQFAAERLANAEKTSKHRAQRMYIPHPTMVTSLSELTKHPKVPRTREGQRRR